MNSIRRFCLVGFLVSCGWPALALRGGVTTGNGEDATSVPAVQQTSAVGPLKQVVDVIAPVPVRTALDQVVLTNGLAPLLDVESSGSAKTAELPSLHGELRKWMTADAASNSTWTTQLEGGAALFRVGNQTDTAPEVTVRIRRQPSPLPSPEKGEGGSSPFSGDDGRRPGEGPLSIELASILPHELNDGFQAINQTVGTTSFNARAKSSYEVHAAAIYALPHGSQEWAVPEIGLGVSMLEVVDQIKANITTRGTFQFDGVSYPYTDQTLETQNVRRYSFSPLLRLGVTLAPNSVVSVRLSAAYVGYGNTVQAFAQTFDLGMAGMMYRAGLQVRL